MGDSMALFSKKQTAVTNDLELLPKHIAIIMDGNGRWAKKRNMPRKAGHSAGAAAFRKIARYANKIGIRYMTVYAFSTENWKRPKDEVEGIMKLLRDYLNDVSKYKDENIRLRFIGDRSMLSPDIVELMYNAEKESADATGMVLNIAVNYGGRDEIVNAVRKTVQAVKNGELSCEDITEDTISSAVYTAGQPDPDLIIRPSGEYRLSNFLIWQCAYAEFWYSDILWPDFNESHLDAAIEDYIKRNRRFGGV